MCTVSRTYSNYQKNVIKQVTKLIGSIPFIYQKTKNNHLKLLISGVEKPLYTGSTPSDKRSINNFIGEVKLAIKSINRVKVQPTASMNNSLKNAIPNGKIASHDKHEAIITKAVKSIRCIIPTLITKEEKIITAQNLVEGISQNRKNIIAQAINRHLKQNKAGDYLVPSALKTIEKSLLEHVNFMMPTPAYYAKILKANQLKDTSHKEASHQVVTMAKQKNKKVTAALTKNNKAPTVQNKAINITSLVSNACSASKRISALRALTPKQANSLIAEVQQAMVLNSEAHLAYIIHYIDENNLDISMLISRLKQVA